MNIHKVPPTSIYRMFLSTYLFVVRAYMILTTFWCYRFGYNFSVQYVLHLGMAVIECSLFVDTTIIFLPEISTCDVDADWKMLTPLFYMLKVVV